MPLDNRPTIPFFKYQAVGNDFVLIDKPQLIENQPELAIKICDRNFGVGADGLIILDGFKMTFLNPDGTYDVCGNGMRCVGLHLHRKNNLKSFTIQTAFDDIDIESVGDDFFRTSHRQVTAPQPLLTSGLAQYKDFSGWLVNPGTPHFCLLVEDLQNYPVKEVGSYLEHNLLPDQTCNVDFIDKDTFYGDIKNNGIKIRIWERSVGETLGCGTAAIAVGKVVNQNFKLDLFNVCSLGGQIEWGNISSDGVIHLTGKAIQVMTGDFLPQGNAEYRRGN